VWPVGELIALPRLPSWIKGEGEERWEWRGEGNGKREGGEGEEGKGRTPQCLKCVDAHVQQQ